MLSLVVTALSFCVMLLISGNFIVGAWRERQRQKRAGRQQLIPHTAFHQTAMHISWAQVTHKTGMGETVPQPGFSLPHSWYARRRTLISLGFFVLLALALFVQSGLADGALRSL